MGRRGLMRLAFAFTFLAGSLICAAPELYIDPGHGGNDPGVRSDAGSEAEITLDIASQLQAILKTKGIESALSRSGSLGPLPSARAAAANASGAGAFLSLHVNSSPSAAVHGPRVFIPKAAPPASKDEPRPWGRSAGQKSEEAKKLALELVKTLSQAESGKLTVQNLNLVSFKGLAIPGVAVELGYLSHAESKTRFADAEYRKALAGRLADGVFAWARPNSPSAEVKP